MKILIADDAPFILEIAKTVLIRAGFEVVGEALDGEEAVLLADRLQPDVILMDLIMPKKSGIQAVREILDQRPHTRVIAFSTADQELMITQALEAGCCSYLTKPFTKEQLIQAVSALRKAI